MYIFYTEKYQFQYIIKKMLNILNIAHKNKSEMTALKGFLESLTLSLKFNQGCAGGERHHAPPQYFLKWEESWSNICHPAGEMETVFSKAFSVFC